jgi:Flp pilus assembly protein TadD
MKIRAKKPSPANRQLWQGLQKVEELTERCQWVEADELLNELNRRFPNRPEVLTEMVNVAGTLKDYRTFQSACLSLSKLTPNDPLVLHNLAMAYVFQGRVALSIRTLRRFVQRFPRHELTEKNRVLIAELEVQLVKMTAPEGFPEGPEGFEWAVLHEEAQVFMESGDYAKGRQAAERLIQLAPAMSSPRNNLALMWFMDGAPRRAVETARQVLEFQPENVHALGNLARFLDFTGQAAEAREVLARLKAAPVEKEEHSTKKAETCSFLGDHQGVLDAWDEAQRHGWGGEDEPFEPMFLHLVAAASFRLGREKEARQLWQQALQAAPYLTIAQDNLNDVAKPVGQRDGPFAFPLQNWLPKKYLDDLAQMAQPVARGKQQGGLQNALRRYLDSHPELVAYMPRLLELADGMARNFIAELCGLAATPETLAVLREFALGPHGTDEARFHAAIRLREHEALDKRVEMYLHGERQEMLLLSYEITHEPEGQLSPAATKLLAKALAALKRKEGREAETLLREALSLEPDAPSLHNNLAAAFELQGRHQEAMSLTQEIHARHPDYLFAAVNLARAALREKRLEQAKELVKPFLEQERFHVTEMAAYCSFQIELCLAENNRGAAQSWLDKWSQFDGDCDYDLWQRRIEPPKFNAGALEMLKGLLTRRR